MVQRLQHEAGFLMINLFDRSDFREVIFFLKKVVTLVDFENGSRPDADVVL